jgi:O-antigen/teichoic acid export membrane protein
VDTRRRNRIAPIRPSSDDPLLRGAYSLVANAVGTAIVGVAFWVTAARLFDAQTVGIDAALIAAMTELSTICQLNMVNWLTRFLPSHGPGAARAVVRAYALTGVAALVVGSAFALLAPLASGDFAAVFADPAFAVLYVVAQVLWTCFQLQDSVLAGTRQAIWVPVENVVFGVLKLAALPILLAFGASHGVYLASVLPVILLLVPVNAFIFMVAIPRHLRTVQTERSAFERRGRTWMVRFMALDYGGTVLSQTARTALPLLVVALLGARANAYFSVPFTIVTAFTMLVYGAVTALVVEGAIREASVRELTARLTRRFAFLLVPATIVLVAAAPLLLLPFGPAYAAAGTSVLRILAIGGALRSVTTLYIAIARLRGQGTHILALEGLQMALLVVAVLALAHPFGIEGVAAAWLIATGVTAAVALPALGRFLKGGSRASEALDDLAPRAGVAA